MQTDSEDINIIYTELIELLTKLNFKYYSTNYLHVYSLTYNKRIYRFGLLLQEYDRLIFYLFNIHNSLIMEKDMDANEAIEYVKDTFKYELRKIKINKLL